MEVGLEKESLSEEVIDEHTPERVREEAMWEEHLREKSAMRKGPEQALTQRDGDECEQIRGKEVPDQVKDFDLILKWWKVITMLSARV